MTVDYHLHTFRCHHARGTMEQYLAQARALGLKEIGFADHFPLKLLEEEPQRKVSMEPEELPAYVAEVLELARSSGEVSIRLGAEVDWLPGTAGVLPELLKPYPFDFIIGSVHFMEAWDFSHPDSIDEYDRRDLREVYRRYFRLVWEACSSGLFDIIGHVDVIKKFGHRYPGDLEEFWQQTAALLRENDTCLELNTSGRDAPVGEFYPPARLLEICRERGVGVTLGSDAHAPEQVGRHFREARQLLVDVGYRELAVFRRRQRDYIPVEGE